MTRIRLLSRLVRRRTSEQDSWASARLLLHEQRRSAGESIGQLRESGIGSELAVAYETWLAEIPVNTSAADPEHGHSEDSLGQLRERGVELETLARSLLVKWGGFLSRRDAYRKAAPSIWEHLESRSGVVLLFKTAAAPAHLDRLQKETAALFEEIEARLRALTAVRDDWNQRLAEETEQGTEPTQEVGSSTASLEDEVQDLRARFLARSTELLVDAGVRVDAASGAQLDQAVCGAYRVWRASRSRSTRFFMDRLQALRDCNGGAWRKGEID